MSKYQNYCMLSMCDFHSTVEASLKIKVSTEILTKCIFKADPGFGSAENEPHGSLIRVAKSNAGLAAIKTIPSKFTSWTCVNPLF